MVKAPGNDGLTEGFYVCFFEEVGWLLCKTLNFLFNNGELRQLLLSLKRKIVI